MKPTLLQKSEYGIPRMPRQARSDSAGRAPVVGSLIAEELSWTIVNDVGLARHERVDAVDPDVFAIVMDLKVGPVLQLAQALLPGVRAARFGRINITSLVTRGLAFRSSYAAAKAAL